jgi:hypothetical protein
MHASLWRFAGDADDLLRKYEAIIAEIPIGSMLIHLCLRAPDGIVVIDTCPSEESFHAFASGPFLALRAKHGLPDPDRVDDYPVHTSFVHGQRTFTKLRANDRRQDAT